MAWRIHDCVVRGEIDNRVKGIIRGRIWLLDRADPAMLELKGNACGDIAGCLLTFQNPFKPEPHPHLKNFNSIQRGVAGNMTASQKVRVFDIPFDEAYARIKRGEKPPEHMANSLYLEWFSDENGRVVVESADYKIEISPPAWQWTREDEAERAKNAGSGWENFTKQLNQTVESQRHESPKEIEDWDEFDFEKSLRESDARTDKYFELLDKYGDNPDKEQLIAKEMGWLRDEEGGGIAGEDPSEENRGLDVEEINRIFQEAVENPLQPDPATEGVDWLRVENGGLEDICHPLQHRCFESAMALWHTCDQLGLLEKEDDALHALVNEFQTTGAKLAGALNGLAYGRDTDEPGFVVACLKRALNHLHNAQAGLESVAPKKLLPEIVLAQTRSELFEIREEILRLMQEFRKE